MGANATASVVAGSLPSRVKLSLNTPTPEKSPTELLNAIRVPLRSTEGARFTSAALGETRLSLMPGAESCPVDARYLRASGGGDSCPWMNATRDPLPPAAGKAPKIMPEADPV